MWQDFDRSPFNMTGGHRSGIRNPAWDGYWGMIEDGVVKKLARGHRDSHCQGVTLPTGAVIGSTRADAAGARTGGSSAGGPRIPPDDVPARTD